MSVLNCFMFSLCCSNVKWYCRFELKELLLSLGAAQRDVLDWSSGFTFSIARRLKAEHPLLYPRNKDILGGENELDVDLMAVGITKTHMPGVELDESGTAIIYPKCSLCDYCPNRNRSDALQRIEAHVRRCHGESVAAQVIEQVKITYNFEKEKARNSKTYKCPPIECPFCGKIIHGNSTSLADHQRSRMCKKDGQRQERPDVPSTSSDGGPAKRLRRK